MQFFIYIFDLFLVLLKVKLKIINILYFLFINTYLYILNRFLQLKNF